MLTGNKNTDYEILYNLHDYDLGRMCQVNKYTRKLCKDDIFWMNRTFKRFSPIFTPEELKNYKTMFGFKKWRNYYIDLVNFLENGYNRNNENIPRFDYQHIASYIEDKTEGYIDCYDKNGDCSMNFEEDFVDLNQVFGEISKTRKISDMKITKEKKWILLQKILDVRWFKIHPFNIRRFYELFEDQAVDVLLNKNNFREVREAILKRMLVNRDINTSIIFYKVFPFIEHSDEILNVLFERINYGANLDRGDIILFLDGALAKGANKEEIENRLSREPVLEEAERDNYQYSTSVVRKYMEIIKGKADKALLIHTKLQNTKYPDEIYDDILKLLESRK